MISEGKSNDEVGRTGELTRGIVKDILTNSVSHPHGIKVQLVDGQIGRVQKIEE